MKERTDYGQKADDFFNSIPKSLKPLARELRSLVLKAVPGASEVIKWGMPVYELSGSRQWFCSIYTSKDYVGLQLDVSGVRLDDPKGLLEGTGKKIRHVKIRTAKDIKKRLFTAWVKRVAEPR